MRAKDTAGVHPQNQKGGDGGFSRTVERLRQSLRRLKGWSNEEDKGGGGANDSEKV